MAHILLIVSCMMTDNIATFRLINEMRTAATKIGDASMVMVCDVALDIESSLAIRRAAIKMIMAAVEVR